MKKVFWFIALSGLVLGFIIHIISLLGIYVGEYFPIWLLHLGIFVVWIPAVIELKKDPALFDRKALMNKEPFYFFKAILKDVPKFVPVLCIVLFIYTGFNFALFIFSSLEGSPDIIDGKYVLENHGTLIRELSEVEYFKLRANEIRGFSGHWMVFYSLSMGILWPKDRMSNNNNNTQQRV